MLPTKFFKDPDVMALSSNDTRLILVGLILTADDAGRELAHPKLLGRELDYAPEVIEAALSELVANDLLLVYEVGKHRYYSLQQWNEWQTLNKPTPSKYPAPPQQGTQDPQQVVAALPQIPPDFLGESGGIPSEEEGEQNRTEEEEEVEGEGGTMPPNVVAFPTAHGGGDDEKGVALTQQVAAILRLAPNDALRRVVADHCPTLSLLGEADAAVEWIEDPKRNKKKTPMTLNFFRNWVKREQEATKHREAHRQQLGATGTHGPHTGKPTPVTPAPTLPKSLMNLEAHYHAARTGEKRENT